MLAGDSGQDIRHVDYDSKKQGTHIDADVNFGDTNFNHKASKAKDKGSVEEARNFEMRLGGLAFGRAGEVANQVCGKATDYLKKKATKNGQVDPALLKEQLAKVVEVKAAARNVPSTVAAGNVGTNPLVVAQLLPIEADLKAKMAALNDKEKAEAEATEKQPANLREKMTDLGPAPGRRRERRQRRRGLRR
jgi:hypothetical protein